MIAENNNAPKDKLISIGLKHVVFNVLIPIKAITLNSTNSEIILRTFILECPKNSQY